MLNKLHMQMIFKFFLYFGNNISIYTKGIKNGIYDYYGFPLTRKDLPIILLGVLQGLLIGGAVSCILFFR